MFGFTSFSELPFSDVSSGVAVDVTAGTGVLTLNALTPTVQASVNVTPGVATLTLSAFTPTLNVGINETPNIGQLVLTPITPSLLLASQTVPLSSTTNSLVPLSPAVKLSTSKLKS